MCIRKIKEWWRKRHQENDGVGGDVDVNVDVDVESSEDSDSDDHHSGWMEEEVVGEVPGFPSAPKNENTRQGAFVDDINSMWLEIVNDYLGYDRSQYRKIIEDMRNRISDVYAKWSGGKWNDLEYKISYELVLGKDTDGDGEIEIAHRIVNDLCLSALNYNVVFWIDLNIPSGLFSLKFIKK